MGEDKKEFLDIKPIWPRKKLFFGKDTGKKDEKTELENKEESLSQKTSAHKPAGEKQSGKVSASSIDLSKDLEPKTGRGEDHPFDPSILDQELAMLDGAELSPEPVVKVVDVASSVQDPTLKISAGIRNYGKKPALETKVKIMLPNMVWCTSTPMITIGDLESDTRIEVQWILEMSPKYHDEWLTFSIAPECLNGKGYQQTFTVKTGRKPVSVHDELKYRLELEKARAKRGLK